MNRLSTPTQEHSLDYWLNYLNQLHTSSIDLGLERIQPLAQKMGLIHFACPVFCVGGTNGKGSCVRFLEAIYSASAYKVGAYTSPHLMRFNERLRINESEVDDEIWIKAFNIVEKQRGGVSLSFFEFTTLAALLICKQAELDVLILEVGLGGRLDAVNVVDSDVAIITAIDLDHQDYLGDTREAIAFEKAGIFKVGKEAICGDLDIPLKVYESAEKNKVSLHCLNRDFFYQDHGHYWTWTGPLHSYFNLPVLHLKMQNAATALMAVDLFLDRLPVSETLMKNALAKADLPGRFERVDTPIVPVYLDVAHNPHAAMHLAEKLVQSKSLNTGKTLAVFGMLKDKDAAGTLKPLLPLIDEWFVAELETERSASAQDLAKLIGFEGKNCYTFAGSGASVREALKAAMEQAEASDRIVVFGSFYAVAAAKECLQKAVETTEALELIVPEPEDLSAESSIQNEPHEKQNRGFNMSPNMRHRIIGLLVLLGLAALFLPLLFSKREPIDEVARLAKQVPPAPAIPAIDMKLAGVTADAAVTQSSPSTSPEGVAAVPVTTTAETMPAVDITTTTATAETMPPTPPVTTPVAAASVPVVTPPVPALVPEAAAPKESESAKIESSIKAEAKSVKAEAKKVVSPLSAAPQAWTLQLGSFANQAAAETLVQKLRTRGFDAYSRQTQTSDRKMLTRVFVGPEIDKAKLVKIQKDLGQELKLRGVIRKYNA